MKKLLLLSLVSIFSSYSFAEDNSSIYRGLGTGPEDFLNFQILKQKGFLAKNLIFQEQTITIYTNSKTL